LCFERNWGQGEKPTKQRPDKGGTVCKEGGRSTNGGAAWSKKKNVRGGGKEKSAGKGALKSS